MKREPHGHFIVGIDLGTTYSLVATIDAGRPTIIPNALGELLTPSAVSRDDDGALLVGAAARARAGRFPERTAMSFKRDMGTDREHHLGDERFSSIELSALVLQSLKRDAEVALGGTVDEAVITVPAYFGEQQRRATIEAAKLAGLRVDRLVNEPTAAALAYGFQRRRGESVVIVLDLGGGTFDVTVLRLIDGIVEILASAGDTRLGGDDFTRALARLIGERAFGADLDDDDRGLRAELFEAAELAKRRLSTRLSVQAAVQAPSGGARTVELTLVDAERCWDELVQRMEGPITQALRDARLDASAIEDVLLVGGATRMPVVRSLGERTFRRAPLENIPADEAVALGAAVQAALVVGNESVEDLVSTDIAPFSLGIRTAEHFRGQLIDGLYTPILERGTVLPASRAKLFSTLHPAQTEILVEVFQGEHASASRNSLIGSLSVTDLPRGQFNTIEVRFTYDLNGVLEVETSALATGVVKSTIFERGQGTMTDSEREALRRRFQQLKVHPRALLPNRVAIERAEELFVRLRGHERELIRGLLARFMLAIEAGEHVDEARAALTRATAELSSQ